jgi:uncharacterized membrane protein YtjA (UPF0391 family)
LTDGFLVYKLKENRVFYMLTWVVVFLIIAIVAGLFGFTGAAGLAAQIAKILFVIFLILFIVSLVFHFVPRETTQTLNSKDVFPQESSGS